MLLPAPLSISRTLRDLVKRDAWDSLLTDIKRSESACKASTDVIDAEKLHSGFKEQHRRMDELFDVLRSQQKDFGTALRYGKKDTQCGRI